MSRKPLKIVLVGLGRMGKRWAKIISGDSRVTLSGLVDANESLLTQFSKQFSHGVTCDTRWESGVQRVGVDAVVVATPHLYLPQIARGALECDKHVLTEKPGGIMASDLHKLSALAQKKNKSYMVGFNHRFHPGLWEAKKELERGTIGDVIFIRGVYGHGGRVDYEKEWRFNQALSGGGELLDQGVHMIDLARWFLGEISFVQGKTSNGFWNQNIDENAFLILANARNQTAHIHVSYTQWDKIFHWEVYGTLGYLKVEGLGGQYGVEKLRIGKRSADFKHVDESLKSFEENSRRDPDQSLFSVWDEFIASIEEKRPSIPSGLDGAKALDIVEKVYQS